MVIDSIKNYVRMSDNFSNKAMNNDLTDFFVLKFVWCKY